MRVLDAARDAAVLSRYEICRGRRSIPASSSGERAFAARPRIGSGVEWGQSAGAGRDVRISSAYPWILIPGISVSSRDVVQFLGDHSRPLDPSNRPLA